MIFEYHLRKFTRGLLMTSLSTYCLQGMITLPFTFASATISTTLGRVMGFPTPNLVPYFYYHFQSASIPEVVPLLPPSSLAARVARVASFAGYVLISNQLAALTQETLFRWLLQDKAVNWTIKNLKAKTAKIRKKQRRPLRDRVQKNSELAKKTIKIIVVATMSFAIASLYYNVEAWGSNPFEPNHREVTLGANFAFFATFGMHLYYGYVYEKRGLAASIGAHTAWKMFYDLWFINSWKLNP